MIKLRGRKIRDNGAIDDDLNVDLSMVRGKNDAHFKYFDTLFLVYGEDPRELVAHLCAHEHEFTLPVLRAVASHILSGMSGINGATTTLAPYATKAEACKTLREAVGTMTVRSRFGRYLRDLMDIPKQIIWSNKVLSRWMTLMRPYFAMDLMQYIALSDKPQMSVLYELLQQSKSIKSAREAYHAVISWRELCKQAKVAVGKLASGQKWSILKIGRGINPQFSIRGLGSDEVGLAQILSAFLEILVQRQDETIKMMLTQDATLRSEIRAGKVDSAANKGYMSGLRDFIIRRKKSVTSSNAIEDQYLHSPSAPSQPPTKRGRRKPVMQQNELGDEPRKLSVPRTRGRRSTV